MSPPQVWKRGQCRSHGKTLTAPVSSYNEMHNTPMSGSAAVMRTKLDDVSRHSFLSLVRQHFLIAVKSFHHIELPATHANNDNGDSVPRRDYNLINGILLI